MFQINLIKYLHILEKSFNTDTIWKRHLEKKIKTNKFVIVRSIRDKIP